MMNRFILAFAAIVALASSAHAQSAPSVLDAARQAAGAWTHIGTIKMTGTERMSGFNAKGSRIEDVKTGRWRHVFDSGILRTDDVWDGRDMWHQDRSGGVHAYNSSFMRTKALSDAWLIRRDYLKPDAAGAQIQSLGQKTEGARSFDLVQATPRGGAPVELWFDGKTHLLDRSVVAMPTYVETTHYGDYVARSGAQVAQKIAIDDGTPADTDTFMATQAAVARSATDTDFAKPVVPNDFTIAGGVATVPMIYNRDIIVSVMLNGKGPFSFILDTGGHAIITPEVAKALDLKPVGAGAEGGTGGGTEPEQYVRIDREEIGGVTLRDQSFDVIPLQYETVELGANPPLAGILGLELFERFAIHLDYQKQSLIFRALADAPPGKGVPVPITFTEDTPLLGAKIDDIPGDVMLDTGNAGMMGVLGFWAGAHGLGPVMRAGLSMASFGAGGMSRIWINRIDFEIAGQMLPHMAVGYSEDKRGALSSRTSAGIIGSYVLMNFRLDFDYGRGVVWFDRVPGVAQPPGPRSGLDFYKPRAQFFIVAMIAPGAPAAEAGIAVGDKITRVDGTPASSLSKWDFYNTLARDPGTKVRLSIQRGSEHLEKTITLRELLP